MPFDLDSAIGFVVGRTCHFLRKAFRQTFAAAGHSVTPEEWVLLNRLWVRASSPPRRYATAPR